MTRKQRFFMLDQLAVQCGEECVGERPPRPAPLLWSPFTLLPLILRQITMGIQVRRVLKPRAAATAYDHASQTEPTPTVCSNPQAQQGAKATAPRKRTIYVYSQKHLLTRVYRIFGLRHGTMMIAIHDLLWSSFVVFLLVLATAHSREVSRIVEGDMQAHMAEHAAAERAEHMAGLGSGLADQDNQNRTSFYMQYVQVAYDQARSMMAHDNNEVKLHTGLHVATMMTMLMVFGISMAGIDMIASMMLLAGAMLNVRQLMMPWLSLRLIEMLLVFGGTLVVMLVYARGIMLLKVFLVSLALLAVILYHWSAAYSLHEHICRMERTGLVHSTHSARPMALNTSLAMLNTASCPCSCPGVPGGGAQRICGPRVLHGTDGTRMVWSSVYKCQLPDLRDGSVLQDLRDSLLDAASADKNDLLTGSNRNLSATTPPMDGMPVELLVPMANVVSNNKE
ncbi:uncharacterized protein LOC113205610 [Frankliniella occidentalis]|uniref:Uncharacterized protein LOC113205610 n=1 Tax=Frankliniella occidentalis TaxID=133901 RepID=A0A9C6WZE7_FRAOC|nr:uncharacterized protein LOC113205610 [Frankliniella occidentalis]